MIRVRISAAKGSTPRDAGAEMFVTPDRVTGTIGGGQLEYMAIDRARQMLARNEAQARMDVPLGPEIGQCCGGRVVLTLDRAAPRAERRRQALVFGAGHVGRALAPALSVLPLEVTLIDSRPEELALARGVTTRLTPIPEAELRAARAGDIAVILTHDHALDFLLAAEALSRGDLAYVGMIGSATKRARFARFARGQGIDPAPLVCPIGTGGTPDKRPEFIAAFTMAEIARLVSHAHLNEQTCDN
ncbi:xanthine dehydrogenase accessory protein XdhC [Paracoccus sp. PARArs4]|uniref:xanthine dehydrogenase accessory protein XdhC n=1 Tax=Paracoccus sp. PARArs4 TaxID=2853442 RepID=UPI0024A69E4D|nr:xanthine dehydrogenase accessory protein XdhC [Paracoccus sp. PARArs4]